MFTYIKYNEESQRTSEEAKQKCEQLLSVIDSLPASRESSLAKTNLEQCFMWIGKAIRNKQLLTDKEEKHLPERNNN